SIDSHLQPLEIDIQYFTHLNFDCYLPYEVRCGIFHLQPYSSSQEFSGFLFCDPSHKKGAEDSVPPPSLASCIPHQDFMSESSLWKEKLTEERWRRKKVPRRTEAPHFRKFVIENITCQNNPVLESHMLTPWMPAIMSSHIEKHTHPTSKVTTLFKSVREGSL
ncbi:hypothetical protein STEG23_035535, partial [Scotinomys teguina]